MRNVFDQYRQSENQLSHALATVLTMENALCRRFVRWLADFETPRGAKLSVEQQRVPGIAAVEPEEGDRKGLPDICIHADSDWCVAIESKVGSSLTADQLRRHRKTVRRYFERVLLIAITAESKPRDLPKDTLHRTWVDVYVWMGEQPERENLWVRQLRDFMRLLESRLASEGHAIPESLTMFDGIPFDKDHPYSYLEAKLLIRQAIPLMRQRKALKSLGVDSACTGRSAITGKDSIAVWDYISLKPAGESGSFTEWPHLTMGIHNSFAEARLTMPNSINGESKKAFRNLGEEGFLELSGQIARNMRKAFGDSKGYKPVMKIVHRHYASQRSVAEIDGDMEVDLRASINDGVGRVKMQRHWFDAGYRLLTEKNGCNVQLQMGVNFPHTGNLTKGSGAIENLEKGWVACEPLINILLRK